MTSKLKTQAFELVKTPGHTGFYDVLTSGQTIRGRVWKQRSQSPRTNAVGTRWFFARTGQPYEDEACPAHGYETRIKAVLALLDEVLGAGQ